MPPAGGVDTGGPGAIVGRRGGSAGHRAVLGGLLVAAAAVIVFAAVLSASGRHEATYVVAARPLPAGSVIGPGDTTTGRFSLSGPTSAAAFTQPAPLIGRSVAVDVQPGQLIESPMLAAGGAARLRPVSIPVDSDSLAALAAGQAVDVLATPSASAAGSGGSAPQPSVTMVLRGATLLSLGRSSSGLLSGGSGATVVVTLGVSDLAEAERLVEAAHTGTVELLRADPADGTGLGPTAAVSAPTTAGGS